MAFRNNLMVEEVGLCVYMGGGLRAGEKIHRHTRRHHCIRITFRFHQNSSIVDCTVPSNAFLHLHLYLPPRHARAVSTQHCPWKRQCESDCLRYQALHQHSCVQRYTVSGDAHNSNETNAPQAPSTSLGTMATEPGARVPWRCLSSQTRGRT